MSPFPVITEILISALSGGSDCCRVEALGGPSMQLQNARQIGNLGQPYGVLRHKTMLRYGVLGGHLYTVFECSAAWEAERQYCVVFVWKALLWDGFWEDASAQFQVAR